MVIIGILLLWGSLAIAAVLLYRVAAQRERALERFSEPAGGRFSEGSMYELAPRPSVLAGRQREVSGDGIASTVVGARRVSRRWILFPWLIGAAVGVTMLATLSWPLQYVLAICAVVSLLLSQLEGFFHLRHLATLERQLADAIDIMVGAVGAGAAIGPAMDAAADETDRPLKPYLEEISGRIRLGDDPVTVFRSLADRIPLETFLLFSSAMAVHYEVGGRLAPTLATVGRTIRDRIEVTRRIESNIAQSQFSTIAIVGLVYLIAVIVWRNGPDAMREFVTSSAGSWFVAGSIVLQAVGIVWMNLISKPRF